MKNKQNKKSDRPKDNLDHIMDRYKRNNKKGIENSHEPGSAFDEYDKPDDKLQRIRRIVSIVTQFSLLLGFLIFLILWLL